MKKLKSLALLSLFCIIYANVFAQSYTVTKNNIQFNFSLDTNGAPTYSLTYKGKVVIAPSALGIAINDVGKLTKGFTILGSETEEFNQNWEPVWGEVKSIKNDYKSILVHLQTNSDDKKAIKIDLIFKVFDDGLGFRYSFPIQQNLNHFIVTDELTNFQLTANHKTFWIPGDYDTNEYPYTISKLSDVDVTSLSKASTEISTRKVVDIHSVQTPLMMKTADGLYINLHEAALVNYPAMQLHVNRTNFDLSSNLVPDAFGNKAYVHTPFATPWRTILVSDKASDILASKMILNLNEPSKIADPSFIKPQKFVGVWWEMHVGMSTWDYAGTQNASTAADVDHLKASGKHGATTQRTKKYIDFAAANGISSVLVEGWNVGWEDWFGQWKEDVFDFVTPYPDYNVKELQDYASSKGVKIIMHHETSASVTNYERQQDTAYRFMKKFGYDAVKTGYVGKIIPRGEYHDGQWMVNHYIRTAQKMADYHIMLDAHEPVRPTGLHRTYPNWMASEAARGNEFNAWSVGNPPAHETILPFTRLIGGPMDYTPGIFKIKLAKYGKPENQVHTTLAKQLALYVTLYSPLQMAADIIENYEEKMDAFQFIKDVSVDWDDTKILTAEPGEYIATARKAKGTNNWFLGAITNQDIRKLDLALNFLDSNASYILTTYADAPNASWDKNPEAYEIRKSIVNNKTVLKANLANGGGLAASIIMANKNEIKGLKKYQSK